MKKLYLIRHAKSSWADASLRDFDRPLNKRGKRDAPIMSQWLKDKIGELDLIISSPAKRAKKTAKEFAKTFDTKIDFHKTLYHADVEQIYTSVYGTDNSHKAVAMFGHNPGFTYFANEFASQSYIDNVPTCGIVSIISSCNSWEEFSSTNAQIEFFMYPKKMQQE